VHSLNYNELWWHYSVECSRASVINCKYLLNTILQLQFL